MKHLSAVQLDRAVGVLLGSAAGDALGAGYEFTTPGPTQAEMVGGGAFGWAPGQWTDDTQMAICIAEETATGHLDPLAVGERFLAWYATNPPDVGNQTRAALSGARSAAELTEVAADVFARRPSRSSGNGSLMRTAPVALSALGDDDALVHRAMTISALTHGDPVAAQACVIWCVAIDRAVREGRLDGWTDGADLLDASARDRWRSWLHEAETMPPERFRPNGYVVTALQAAVSAIVSTPVPADQACVHLQDALRRAVSIGDDTDTVAAIAGAVLGGRWGASAVPFAWRRLLHGWPGYRARDLGRLAALSARGGSPDSMGWPSAPRLLPTYLSTQRPKGVVRPLAEDSGLLLGDVGGLAAVEGKVDAVVSLCRIGVEDVPSGVEHHESWLIDVEDPATNPNLSFLLSDTAAAVATLRSQEKRVFLHCVHGQRRTPAVAAAYLASTSGMSGMAAFEVVGRSLPGTMLNSAFGAALRELWP